MTRKVRSEILSLRGRDVPVRVQLSRRASHISLRLDERSGGVDLILPSGVPKSEGLDFAHEKANWILKQIDALPESVPFVDGAIIPMMGTDYLIRHHPEARGAVWVEDGSLNVAGGLPHVARRVQDWLKKSAKREITWRAQAYAHQLDRKIARITLRDPRSRWGSCSDENALSFSWRIVMAPKGVLEYVVAHEVAHLVELNHGTRFWALVRDICPDCDVSKYWLKRDGATLHRFG